MRDTNPRGLHHVTAIATDPQRVVVVAAQQPAVLATILWAVSGRGRTPHTPPTTTPPTTAAPHSPRAGRAQPASGTAATCV